VAILPGKRRSASKIDVQIRQSVQFNGLLCLLCEFEHWSTTGISGAPQQSKLIPVSSHFSGLSIYAGQRRSVLV
jgi:hypothetical protein